MASTAGLSDLQKHGILVTINLKLDDFLCVARGFTLDPQSLPRPAPICSSAGFEGRLERVGIHPSEHQDFLCIRILGDCRD